MVLILFNVSDKVKLSTVGHFELHYHITRYTRHKDTFQPEMWGSGVDVCFSKTRTKQCETNASYEGSELNEDAFDNVFVVIGGFASPSSRIRGQFL